MRLPRNLNKWFVGAGILTALFLLAGILPFPKGGFFMSRKKMSNHLIHEKSPYLLQHAHNPVDWYPWGEEAFEKARREDKPIFLSIGYSTCHWCHVMEKESFEDPEVARLLNETFVCIKVDREERPDIDAVYMTVCQLMTGSGGWPLTIFLTPDKKPFFAATYIPRESRFGRIGLLELIPRVKKLWQTDREKLLQGANEVVQFLQKEGIPRSKEPLQPAFLEQAYQQFVRSYDSRWGGFGKAPKFPSPHNLIFLLRYGRAHADSQAQEMAETTLTRMRLGGIYDQLGGGFHRYSTDARWLVPHFEKMLYDQALHLLAYTEAFQLTRHAFYASTVQELVEYIQRNLLHPDGGFYSAEDADSEGEEGKFYLWTLEEIRQVLPDSLLEFAIRVFHLSPTGNFHPEAGGMQPGANILYPEKLPEQLVGELGLSLSEFQRRLEDVRQRLFRARQKRVPPLRDDKILTDWNGLMIAALARAGWALEQPSYLELAQKAASFLWANQWKDPILYHRYREGETAIPGYLDDYAFLLWGLVELYEATGNPEFLKKALLLVQRTEEHFWDAQSGGFYFTSDFGEDLLVRKKESADGAIPSGNAVMAYNLLRLARLTGDSHYEERANQCFQVFADPIRHSPTFHAFWLMALEFAYSPGLEVVVVDPVHAPLENPMVQQLRQLYLPESVILYKSPQTESLLNELAPFTASLHPVNGKSTAYVCQNFQCNLPTTGVEEMLRQILADDR